jgi:SAM-dependent methyltransferase
MAGLPLPPLELAERAGRLGSLAAYEAVGKALRETVDRLLPPGWSWSGKRVLDFGCGAGRVLRHFMPEAAEGDFTGCDIDAAGVAWLNANLNPPLHAFVNGELPPLPRPNASFDLIYAFSVFTHLTDSWSAWLVELHRLLAPEGVLIASFLGEGMSELVAGEPWVEERIGRNVLQADLGWDAGGPVVQMSPWWIREHWGRAFEIEALEGGATVGTHGTIAARPKPGAPTVDELERIDPAEPREVTALRHNVRQLQREAADARAELAGYANSRSWRVTAPLRRIIGRRSRAARAPGS